MPDAQPVLTNHPAGQASKLRTLAVQPRLRRTAKERARELKPRPLRGSSPWTRPRFDPAWPRHLRGGCLVPCSSENRS